MSRANLKITKDKDIRRISVPQNISYAEFLKTLGYLYGPLPEGFLLKYEDEENDLVSITHERELRDALSTLNGRVLKLVVVLPGIDAENDQEAGPAYHEAYCNHCGVDIYGIRYKCGNCSDFDLCDTCEAHWSVDFSIHDVTHTFLKIYTPLPERFTDRMILPENLYEQPLQAPEDVANPAPVPAEVVDVESDWALREIESAMVALNESRLALRKMSLEPEDDKTYEVSEDDGWSYDHLEDISDVPQQGSVYEEEIPEIPQDDEFPDVPEITQSVDTLPVLEATPEVHFDLPVPQAAPLVELPIIDPLGVNGKEEEPDQINAVEEEHSTPAPDVPQPAPLPAPAAEDDGSVIVSFWRRLQNAFSNEVEWRDEWTGMLRQLEEMGFNDKERARQAIMSNRGNLNNAVEALLQN